jgi:hypothetical protein
VASRWWFGGATELYVRFHRILGRIVPARIGTPTARPGDCELLVDTSTGFEENQFRNKSLGL